MAITDIDEQKLEAFITHAATEVGAALNVALVTLGDELGSTAHHGRRQPVTPAELALRTGTQERYVREWLSTQAASGFVDYDPDAAAYALPPEHALVLADDGGPFSLTGTFQAANAAVAIRERLAGRFTGGASAGTAPSRPLARHRARSRRATARTWSPSGCRRSTASSRSSRPARASRRRLRPRRLDDPDGRGVPGLALRRVDYHAESIATARQRGGRRGRPRDVRGRRRG